MINPSGYERTRAGEFVDRLVSAVGHALPHGRPLPDDLWRSRHRGILALLWLHVVGVSVFGILVGREALSHAIALLPQIPPAQSREWLDRVFASESLGPAALEGSDQNEEADHMRRKTNSLQPSPPPQVFRRSSENP